MNIQKRANSLTLFVIAGMLIFSGCKDKSAMLVKQWKLDDLKYTKEIPKNMKPQIDKSVNEIKNKYSITYDANGTYHTQMGTENANGTWKLNWNSSLITTLTDKGLKTEYDVIELTDQKFSFRAVEGKEEVIFVLVPAK